MDWSVTYYSHGGTAQAHLTLDYNADGYVEVVTCDTWMVTCDT